MSDKKLFSTLSALAIGAVVGIGVAATPVVAVADHHEGKEHAEKKCGGEKKEDAEKKCGGEKKEDAEKKCGGEKKEDADKSCGGDKGCGGKH